MDANKAKTLATKARDLPIDKILAAIQKCAELGDLTMRYDLDGNEIKFAENVIVKLKSLGFKVKREVGYDQRDSISWDYLVIDWN